MCAERRNSPKIYSVEAVASDLEHHSFNFAFREPAAGCFVLRFEVQCKESELSSHKAAGFQILLFAISPKRQKDHLKLGRWPLGSLRLAFSNKLSTSITWKLACPVGHSSLFHPTFPPCRSAVPFVQATNSADLRHNQHPEKDPGRYPKILLRFMLRT